MDDLLEDRFGDAAEPGLFYVRKTIDASDWEAAQEKDAEQPAHQVLVSGLPKALCSEMMFKTILEQCGIENAVPSFKVNSGKSQVGQVLITLESHDAAGWCAYHFHGRSWGGTEVSAEVLPNHNQPEVPELPELIGQTWESQEPESDIVPLPEWQWACAKEITSTTPLVPDAPEFVPSHLRAHEVSGKAWLEEAADVMRATRDGSLANSSNASTRDRDEESGSSSGDEVSKGGSAGGN